MLSVRVIALAALAVYLLPTDPSRQQSFAQTAESAFTWVSGFCERNPETCETAGRHWASMKEKASFGASVVYELAMRQVGRDSDDDGQGSSRKIWLDHPPVQRGRGTLTREDLAPAWRRYGDSDHGSSGPSTWDR
ncbi:MAG: DUF5330 domain-containing protein [Hyphomicrobiaceae bacterium]